VVQYVTVFIIFKFKNPNSIVKGNPCRCLTAKKIDTLYSLILNFFENLFFFRFYKKKVYFEKSISEIINYIVNWLSLSDKS